MTDNSDFTARYLLSPSEPPPEEASDPAPLNRERRGQHGPRLPDPGSNLSAGSDAKYLQSLRSDHESVPRTRRPEANPANFDHGSEGAIAPDSNRPTAPIANLERQPRAIIQPTAPLQSHPERAGSALSGLQETRDRPPNHIGGPPTMQPGDHWPPPIDPAARWAPRVGAAPEGAEAGHHIQLSEVVKQRREPAEIGWRKVVYLSTGRLLNLGAGPAERRVLDWRARIAANIPGNYQITALSVKGGVGKSRITAGVGSVFAELRKQPVIAIDGNPTYGGLGRLIDPTVKASLREFLTAEDLVDYPRARYYTGQNKQGLEVLAGNQNVAHPLVLGADTFTDTISRARRFYQLALVDCGAEIEHPVIPAVLSASDSLMIVGSCDVEGGLAVETTIDWLAARNGYELLKRSIVVLNDSHRCASTRFIEHVRETLGNRVHSVQTIPWDPHLQEAITLDFQALKQRARLAFMQLAAELAAGFPTAGAVAV